MLVFVLALGLAQGSGSDPYRVSWAADGAVTGAALLAAPLTRAIPAPATAPWTRQILPIDDAVEHNFSARAASLSDGLASVTLVVPLAAQAGFGLDEHTGQAALGYAEALAVNELLTGTVKRLVGRPRPYTYDPDPRIRAYAEREGSDAYFSFWSGHASTSFTAAVAGAYLFALRSGDERARAALWGLELAVATATAGLRVRAGKHFYSDVIVGALVGSALGFGAVRLHDRRNGAYRPGGWEWAAMGAGVAAGALASGLAPLERSVVEPLNEAAGPTVVPMAVPGGGGLALALAL